jgi:hypothetical protein
MGTSSRQLLAGNFAVVSTLGRKASRRVCFEGVVAIFAECENADSCSTEGFGRGSKEGKSCSLTPFGKITASS